ncbi:sulfite exporter TauE/SafE family protein [Cytophagaceae bacterium ABcell3]|nr:sulfite exporter TauE/SafE family protein [Cytophagaceae bacterium ABcell3]
MLSFFYLFIAGLLGGFIAGLVGIGGGVIYIFIIPFALRYIGVPLEEMPQYTIANSVFAIFFASASANYVLIRLKNFYQREVFIIGLLGVISSAFTVEFVVNTPFYSLKVFNGIIIFLLAYMLYTTLVGAKKVYITPLRSINKWKLGAVGLVGGGIAALSGLGGGVVIIPALNSLLKVDVKKASAISSGAIMITAFTITLINLLSTPVHDFHYFNLGYIIFPVGLSITLGVIIAAPFGVSVSRKVSSAKISYIYSLFLVIVILKKIVELYFLS